MQELVQPSVIDQKRNKKRKFDVDVVPEAKRLKQEVGDGFLSHRKLLLPSLARRPAHDVLEEVVVKVTNGDRQMAGHLLREFSQEHLSSIGEAASAAGDLLLDALLKAKHDQVANGLLRVLKFVLSRVEPEATGATLKRLFQDGNRLVSQLGLEPRILAIVTEGLERGALREEELPQSIFRCSERAMKHIGNSQARVCAVQFQIARCLSAAPNFNSKSCQDLETILCAMILDRDSRVRIIAVEGLLALAERDLFSLTTYTAIRNLTHDTDSHVRKRVLKIFLYSAKKWPSEQVTGSTGQRVLLCDDAFSSICHCINDMEVDVRAEAATLLGEFDNVSDAFLEQTLDKKLMRSMKTTGAIKYEKTSMFSISKQPWVKPGGRWRNWKESNKDKSSAKSSGEWASGKDLNAPCPNKPGTSKEPVDESIIPQGACGAFVSALEDEFMTVRKGAVYSLGKLAAHRPGFASTALEHLTDMFNDEIADVRLDAIHALTPLVVHGQLQKEQLAVMLKCLDDAMFESRQALRELLAKGEFADADCMKVTARALINCLQRFPSDQEMIYKCMSELGSHHGVFVHSMVTGLLDLHPIFEPQEQHIDDVYYKAKLVLVLSAASSYEPVLSLVPEYVLKHYRFMRASVPHLVPAIKSLDEKFGKIARQPMAAITPTSANAEILGQTYSKLCDALFDTTLRERNLIRQFILSDAEAICSFNTVLAGSAQFLAVLSEVCSAVDSLEQTVLCGGDLSRVQNLLVQEVNAVLSAMKIFSGVEPAMLAYLGAVAFHLRLLAGVAKLICYPEAYPAVIQEIREAINEARRTVDSLDCPPLESQETVISGVLDVIDRCGIDDKKFLTGGKLSELLRKNPPVLPTDFNNIDKIRVKWVQITEPDRHLAVEKPIRFTAGYPTSMNMAATLHHFSQEDLSDVRIQIDYPDQTRTFFRPRSADYSKLGEYAHNLSTKVLLHSTTPWTEAALVKFTVVLMTGPAKAIPVVALESPSVRRPASLVAKVRPVHRM